MHIVQTEQYKYAKEIKVEVLWVVTLSQLTAMKTSRHNS
jgi:hypothetical protein